MQVRFTQKFVGFVDVLGFKKMVREAEAGSPATLESVLDELKKFGSPGYRKRFLEHGPKTCPASNHVKRDLDFQLTQISDCLVISSEVSPAGLINLIEHCWALVISLLVHGVMCRGFITRGSICHTDDLLVGTGYVNAFEQEKLVQAFMRETAERGTPFVEVDKAVCEYAKSCKDSCVPEMFARFTEGDGEVTALFPFKRLAHSFMIGGQTKFDPDGEKRSNQNLRESLQKMKERVLRLVDNSNASAVRKAEHYARALDHQLNVCDDTDRAIDQLAAPFPRHRY